MGEIGGRLIPGFDHNNSPSRLLGRQLAGRGVMRTGSGTQCVTAASRASEVWLGSLVVASGSPDEGEEDLACAELLGALLEGRPFQKDTVVGAVRASRAAAKHRPDDADFPAADVDCAVAIDAFAFAMKVDRRAGRAIATAVGSPG